MAVAGLAGAVLLLLLATGAVLPTLGSAAIDCAQPPCFGVVQHSSASSAYELIVSTQRALLIGLPFLVGVLLGVPMIQGETSRRTHTFAWTQGVSRSQWFRGHAAFLLCLAAPAALAAGVVSLWWAQRNPVGTEWQFYDTIGIAPAAFSICALAVGILIGAKIKSAVLGATLTVGAVAALRFAVAQFLRPLLWPANLALDNGPPNTALVTGDDYIDSTGRVLSASDLQSALHGSVGSNTLQQAGIHHRTFYWPADALLPLQCIEAALFIMLAALLFAVASRAVSAVE